MAEQRHVIPNEKGGWAVRKQGSARASSVHATRKEAVERARETVRRAGGGEIVIHTRDGRIRDSDTVFPGPDKPSRDHPAGDPYPPIDRESS